MLRSPITRWLIGIIAFICVLAVLRFKPWQSGSINQTFRGQTKSAPTGIEGRVLTGYLSLNLSRHRFRYADQYFQSV